MTDEQIAQLRKLHGYGWSDSQIGRRIGAHPTGVCHQRARLGLAANRRLDGHLLPRKMHDERLALYRLGKSDSAIARIVGVHRCTIKKWRESHGLQPLFSIHNKPPFVPSTEERRLALYRRGMTDRRIGAAVGLTESGVRGWRKARQLPANDRQSHQPHLPVSIVSMDADLGAAGFNRHALIADDAAAEWLEENGATRW